jgi:protein SCO1/2
LVFCVGLLLVGCAAPASPALHGMELMHPQPASGFTLTDQDGSHFSLAQARGQSVLLYFGFTHCGDICPQTLELLGKARELAHLTPRQVRIVMVTVDPKRDSPAALRAFFRKIGVAATGLTATRPALDAVYRSYGIRVEPQRNDILHTDTIFLIDPQGRLRETLVPQLAPKDIAADLRSVVE